MRGDALQTFKNLSSPSRENLPEVFTAFRKKYVNPQSLAMVKHKLQRLVSNPGNQKLIDFLNELQKIAEDAFRVVAQAIFEQFMYAKMPPHLRKSINQAHLENGIYEQIVSHLEMELELKGLEVPDEMQINTATQQTTKPNPEKPKSTCHQCKKPGLYRKQCRQLRKEREQKNTNKNSARNNNISKNNSGQTNSNTTSKPLQMTLPTVQTTEMTENHGLSRHPVRPVAKRTTQQKNVSLGPMQQTGRLFGIED